MNKRIEELMDETDSWCDANFPPDWLNRVDEFLPQWNNKFAELILEEVMQELFINGYEDAFDHLNKHFGFE